MQFNIFFFMQTAINNDEILLGNITPVKNLVDMWC